MIIGSGSFQKITMWDLTGRFNSKDSQNKTISDEQWQSYLTIYRSEGEIAAVIYLGQIVGSSSQKTGITTSRSECFNKIDLYIR